MNSFKTTINRFCPTAPGSSVFNPPTYLENPASTTYTIKKPWINRDKPRDKYSKKIHQDMKIKPKNTIPSIPARKTA